MIPSSSYLYRIYNPWSHPLSFTHPSTTTRATMRTQGIYAGESAARSDQGNASAQHVCNPMFHTTPLQHAQCSRSETRIYAGSTATQVRNSCNHPILSHYVSGDVNPGAYLSSLPSLLSPLFSHSLRSLSLYNH
jgi:hypothetical protein